MNCRIAVFILLTGSENVCGSTRTKFDKKLTHSLPAHSVLTPISPDTMSKPNHTTTMDSSNSRSTATDSTWAPTFLADELTRIEQDVVPRSCFGHSAASFSCDQQQESCSFTHNYGTTAITSYKVPQRQSRQRLLSILDTAVELMEATSLHFPVKSPQNVTRKSRSVNQATYQLQ
jgi:hypothetical protein